MANFNSFEEWKRRNAGYGYADDRAVLEYQAWQANQARKKTKALTSWLLRNYGITLEQYNAMHFAQGGLCAICGELPRKRRLSVDHDHKTGKVRGLLCSLCNTTLGWFERVENWQSRLSAYLVKSNG